MTTLVPKGSRVSEAFYKAEALICSDPLHVRFAPYTIREETDMAIILRADYLAVGDGYARSMAISDSAKSHAWIEYHMRTIDASLDSLLVNPALRGLIPSNIVYDRERDIFLLADFYVGDQVERRLEDMKLAAQKYFAGLAPTRNPPPNAIMK